MTLLEKLELTYCTCAPDCYLRQRNDPNCAWCQIGTDIVQATLEVVIKAADDEAPSFDLAREAILDLRHEST